MAQTARIEIPSAEFLPVFDQGGVKTAIKATGAKTRDLLMVPIEQLKVLPGLNVRIRDDVYEAHIENVKESIIANGFFQHFPISGYVGEEGTGDDKITFIYVTGGFTRLEAAKRAVKEGFELEALPTIVKPAGTSMVDLTVGLSRDNDNNPLRPYEKAIVVKRLVGYGIEDEKELARRLGFTDAYIKQLLYMMSLPPAYHDLVVKNVVSLDLAVEVARKNGAKDGIKILQDAQQTAQQAPSSRGSTSGATSGRATVTRSTVSRTGGATLVTKKQYITAIKYSLTLPGTGTRDFLKRWMEGEADAQKELSIYKPPRANAAKPKAGGKGRGKGGSKGKGKSNASAKPEASAAANADDAFDMPDAATTEAEDDII